MRRARLLEMLSAGLKDSGLEPDLFEPILDDAEDGSPSAQFIVASAFEKISATRKAIRWYGAAAEQGYQPAKERLRRTHASSAGLPALFPPGQAPWS